MKLIDMKLTPKESKENSSEAVEMKGPDYPYGLCINLDTEALDKLGMDSLPDIGDEIIVHARAKVTRVSASADTHSPDGNKGVELQICAMQLEGETPDADEDDTPAKKLYK